eukprot:TRINITY_DN49467_c0_g1_i2.p1 TRINITY_DN49467_c0_g1~~TRINITY_DN49467_c0_g1_i2.p1  ORF type:complete len:420 (+),score=100.70 TRINITY_DN49467_c0_g1_i2:89-1348(+)
MMEGRMTLAAAVAPPLVGTPEAAAAHWNWRGGFLQGRGSRFRPQQPPVSPARGEHLAPLLLGKHVGQLGAFGVLAAGGACSISRKRRHREANRRGSCCSRLAQSMETITEACYEMKPVEGKGMGMFATRKIKAGELIVCDPPALLLRNAPTASEVIADLEGQFAALPSSGQASVMELMDAGAADDAGKSIEGIVRTNALVFGMETAEGVLCPTVCRFNHSCLPNCQADWREDKKAMQILASVDIAAGSELSIAYVDVRLPREYRLEDLLDRYEFKCCCPACSSQQDSSASDERRGMMQQLDQFCRQLLQSTGPADGAVEVVTELLRLYEEEGLHVPRFETMASYTAFQMLLQEGRVDEAKIWAQRAHLSAQLGQGADHSTAVALAKYAEDPTQHHAYAHFLAEKEEGSDATGPEGSTDG